MSVDDVKKPAAVQYSNNPEHFVAYDGRVTFSDVTGFYTLGKIIRLNVRFHIAKDAGLAVNANLFKITNKEIYGKFFMCYGTGGGTSIVRKFAGTGTTGGRYFVQDSYAAIPTTYKSNQGSEYDLYLDTTSIWAYNSAG